MLKSTSNWMPVLKGKRKEWLTDEILQVVYKKSLAFIEWQNAQGTLTETACKNKI